MTTVNPSSRPSGKLIVIVGPTASGKSDFALELAKKLDGEIISADSRQIYKQLNLGTGKPSQAMMKDITHHLVSFSPLDQTITAAKFAELASKHYRQINQRGKTCLVVGGTGLWIKAFIDGMADLPGQDSAFREQLKEISKNQGHHHLFEQLQKIDRSSADIIGPNDVTRIIRALEIHHLTGQPASSLRQINQKHSIGSAIWFGMDRPRDELYQRCENRIDQWLEEGWIEEVKSLLQTCSCPLDRPALKAIGIPTINDMLLNKIDLARCIELIKRDTRRYIKRQLTWFKKNQRIIWINPQDLDLALNHIDLLSRSSQEK